MNKNKTNDILKLDKNKFLSMNNSPFKDKKNKSISNLIINNINKNKIYKIYNIKEKKPKNNKLNKLILNLKDCNDKIFENKKIDIKEEINSKENKKYYDKKEELFLDKEKNTIIGLLRHKYEENNKNKIEKNNLKNKNNLVKNDNNLKEKGNELMEKEIKSEENKIKLDNNENNIEKIDNKNKKGKNINENKKLDINFKLENNPMKNKIMRDLFNKKKTELIKNK